MAKGKGPPDKGEPERGDDNEMVPIKIQRKVLRKIKMMAANRDMGLAEFIGYLVETGARKELEAIVREIEGGNHPTPPTTSSHP